MTEEQARSAGRAPRFAEREKKIKKKGARLGGVPALLPDFLVAGGSAGRASGHGRFSRAARTRTRTAGALARWRRAGPGTIPDVGTAVDAPLRR